MTNASHDSGDLFAGLDEGAGPALPIADAKARAMIAAAIAGGAPPPGGEGPTGAEITTTASGASSVVKIGAVAAIVSAVIITAVVATRSKNPNPPAAAPAMAATAPNPPAPSAEPPAPVATPVPSLPDTPGTPGTPDTTPPVTPERVKTTPRKTKPSPRATPEDLLRQANKARKSHDWRGANALYGRVMKAHRGSRAGYVATVASAQLYLGKLGQPSTALGLFRRALAQEPRGFLTEEARFGVAESYRKLGNRPAETKALERFLRNHRGSPLTRRARARLDALNSRGAP